MTNVSYIQMYLYLHQIKRERTKWNPSQNNESTDVIYHKVLFLNRHKHAHVKTNKHTRQASMFPLSFMLSMFMFCSVSAISTAVFSLKCLLNTYITTFLRNNQIDCRGVIVTGISTSSWRLIISLWWAVKQSWLWRIHCFIFINLLLLLLFLFVNLDELFCQF